MSLVYFPIEWERQLVYMRTRNAAGTADSYRFDPETVATLNGFFEEPAVDEPVIDPKAYGLQRGR